MRLLNTNTWTLHEFISDDEVPPYAILSHTWDKEEVNFQQWESIATSKDAASDIYSMKGYHKIKQFGEKAAGNGFSWVWIDTCCIDKKSSAELSEAINAMFQWYKNAQVCYVYLEDVSWCSDKVDIERKLRPSRWFTRGWTLQELIAPVKVEFYSTDWMEIGTKDGLSSLLSSITGIDEHILNGGNLEDVSVARRMSWASGRNTSRLEDTAYCLLGIFDVNIPLIYGEGRKAFQRLQEAIMNSTHDQSLFAWGRIIKRPAELISEGQQLGTDFIPWKEARDRRPLLGLFAESPKDFKDSSDIQPVDHGYAHHHVRRNPPTMVNKGVLINLVIYQKFASIAYWDDPPVAQPHDLELTILLCRHGTTGSKLIGLILYSWGDQYYSRTDELFPVNLFVSHVRFESWTRQRHLLPFKPFQFRNGDILLRRWISPINTSWIERPNTGSGPAWRQKCGDRVLRIETGADGDEDESFMFKTSKTEGTAHDWRVSFSFWVK
ncbi:heterokaryon incompatibility protein het-E-1 [Fusarium beomiforme]|uniref:Heterokaryon incompatibility protein het-E-1 n=1 Tax=Fusarium beomiforme TaxID=44412 RepID=A0A9P5DRJ8_9HYPO|nr:heterokaryon incompatibility protein het-E-1 [Fusarium beomiforme]